jgi:hypothetical protein
LDDRRVYGGEMEGGEMEGQHTYCSNSGRYVSRPLISLSGTSPPWQVGVDERFALLAPVDIEKQLPNSPSRTMLSLAIQIRSLGIDDSSFLG